MPEFAVTAIGRDRPGIVAALSGALLDLQGNIADSRMSILRGHFAVMLVVNTPDSVGREELEDRVGEVRERLGLEAVAVNALEELDARSPDASHVLTVYGADHPGIVFSVAAALADRGVNITDLTTRVAGEDSAPLYVMMLEVALGDVPEEDVRGALEAAGEKAEVEVSLRPLEAEAI